MDLHEDIALNSSKYHGYPYYSTVLPIEKEFNYFQAVNWLNHNWHLSYYICAGYLGLVYALQRFMRNRKPVDIRVPFMLWNITLAIFSTGGMFRALPELLFVLKNYGLEFSVCNANMNSVTGLWIALFTFSKAVELVDTVFVVLRKRLTFLHLVHHVLALLITWYFMTDTPALARWTYTLNYTVHSLMYCYFVIKAANIHLPKFVSIGVTSLQILQFVIGFFTSVVCCYFIFKGSTCSSSVGMVLTSIVGNLFFSCIFGRFFVNRYILSNRKGKME